MVFHHLWQVLPNFTEIKNLYYLKYSDFNGFALFGTVLSDHNSDFGFPETRMWREPLSNRAIQGVFHSFGGFAGCRMGETEKQNVRPWRGCVGLCPSPGHHPGKHCDPASGRK